MYILGMTLLLLSIVALGGSLVTGCRKLVAKAEGKPIPEENPRDMAIFSGILFVAAVAALSQYDPNDPKKLRTAEVEKMVMFCWDRVGKESKYPSKAKFGCDSDCYPFGATVSVKQPDGRYLTGIDPTLEPLEIQTLKITGPVEFMNGFGAFIPHKYQCDYKNGKPVDIRVVKGG